MMITEDLIRQLKQVNVSKDVEKTKQRASEAWKAASKDARETILTLTNLALSSIQRAYKSGSISAKIVVAFAQVLNLDPLYLTGEADEKGACSEELLRAFLSDHGYQKLLPEPEQAKPKRRRQSKPKASEQTETVPAPEAAPTTETSAAPEMSSAQSEESAEVLSEAQEPAPICEETQAFLDSVTEDEIMLLVKTVLLRAKAGGKHAEKAQQLKLFLLD